MVWKIFVERVHNLPLRNFWIQSIDGTSGERFLQEQFLHGQIFLGGRVFLGLRFERGVCGNINGGNVCVTLSEDSTYDEEL